MSFKDTIEGHDLDVIFFNEDEYAEPAIYFPLGDMEDPHPISVIFDSIAQDEDVLNEQEIDISDAIPRAEAKQKDMANVDDSDLLFRTKTNVMYKMSNFYKNDNGVIEFHLTRKRRYGA